MAFGSFQQTTPDSVNSTRGSLPDGRDVSPAGVVSAAAGTDCDWSSAVCSITNRMNSCPTSLASVSISSNDVPHAGYPTAPYTSRRASAAIAASFRLTSGVNFVLPNLRFAIPGLPLNLRRVHTPRLSAHSSTNPWLAQSASCALGKVPVSLGLYRTGRGS